jgi:two-component system C4-dicarboxylate transport sensor histidine kinase DctB
MVHENLGEIGGLCNKMSELTRQFKIFARKSEGLPSRIDLRLAIDAALKIITAQQHSSEVRFEWFRPEEPVVVHGDLIRIEQVLVNLIANAVQAVETVEAPYICIDLLEDGDYMQCRIRDNGPGLQASTEQIFEPFFTTKSIKQGLGLGLSISRQILDALGGRLTGRNREDARGAEFVFTLRRGSEGSTSPDPIRHTERAS